jgi:hypothetical protein
MKDHRVFGLVYWLLATAIALAGVVLDDLRFAAAAWVLILVFLLPQLPSWFRSSRKYARRIVCAFRGHKHAVVTRTLAGRPPTIETRLSCGRCDDAMIFRLSFDWLPEGAQVITSSDPHHLQN